MGRYRTKTCGELRSKNIGEEVKLAGWVQKIRNLGSMKFIDLRDQYGITQIVISDNSNLEDILKQIVTECTISVTGDVVKRTSINEKISTGEIEVVAKEIYILGKCKNILPFEVNSEQNTVREDLRLEYRYLDLRNDKIHKNILLRARVMSTLRQKMDKLGFTEIQTPILANSSPEGARDFLVPSRLHQGEFYALPQAPQQFKQLLMICGFDRYYQIAPCFRDEDPRADRSPGEFYQLDFEMSFATQEDVLEVLEDVIISTFAEHSNWDILKEVPRIPYKEVMEKYGTDKPDLRNPLIVQDVTDIFKDTEFSVFKDKTIKVIVTPNCYDKTRKFFDDLGQYVQTELEGKGLAWLKVGEDLSFTGSIAKIMDENTKKELIQKTKVKANDVIFFIADEFLKAQSISGGVRNKLGIELELINKNSYAFCFIVDFPMYELGDEGKVDFNHNPFSMPQGEMESLLNKDPLEIYAYQYDMVCNGYEIASGAVRNHNPEVMVKAFEIAGYTEDTVKHKFGALYNAFGYGPPPHAGAAPGFDRIVMLIADEENIREVIAFPKNKKARDLLVGAPSKVDKEQLKDVHIKLIESDKNI